MDNIVLDQEASRELRVSRAIEIAEERFAKGEIQKEEFEAINRHSPSGLALDFKIA